MATSFDKFRKTVTQKLNYNKNILVLGYGSVGSCIVPLLIKHVVVTPSQITVLEMGNQNKKTFMKRLGNSGVKYVSKEILPNNMAETLSKYVGSGDFIVDVSLNIDAASIIEWCLQNGVMYTNSSLERWRSEPDETIPDLSERTLFYTHNVVRQMASQYPNAATSVVTHGANPGLVTHLTKRALLHLAQKKGIDKIPYSKNDWAELCRDVGVKVIHIAERDTQVLDKPKEVNEFVNTWSCEGFWAEGRAPAEMGWGTHEDEYPEGGVCQGPESFLTQPSITVLMKSWVPKTGPYNGFLVQHSEAVTMSQYFETADGTYRPSVYYVYQPCDAAIASVHELRGRELDMQSKTRIAKDEIISGMDELGVLLIGDDFAIWHGSQLNIEQARKLVPNENATSIQVGANMLGGIIWAIQNPERGYCEPEVLPYDFILKIADPYLGPIVFQETNWRPENDKNTLFKRDINTKNPCSFENFRVWA